MPALFMRLSFWKLLIVVGLVLFFFWPLFAKLVCMYLERRGAKEKGRDSSRRSRRSSRHLSGKCPRCSAELAEGAEFCHRCGRRVGIVDV